MESTTEGFINPIRRLSTRISNLFEADKTELYPSVIYHNVLFFKITYYTCVTPFCLTSSENGGFKIHTNKLQQALTGILHFLAIAFAILKCIPFHEENVGISIIQNPELLFQFAKNYLVAPYFIIAGNVFWRKKNVLETLWNISQNDNPEKKRNVRTIIVNISTVVLILLLVGVTLFNEVTSYTLSSWICYGINHAAREFYLKLYNPELETLSHENCTLSDFSAGVISLGVFQRFVVVYIFMFRNLCIFVILISAIQVYHSCKGFFNALVSDEQDISQVLKHYLSVRELTKKINDFIGQLLQIFVLVLLFYIIDIPEAIKGSLSQRLRVFSVLAVCIAIFIIAADAHRKTQHLKEWLFQYKIKEQSTKSEATVEDRELEEEMYETLKWDCETTKIGLGSQLFTITYGFFALLVSVGTTYGAVQLQFYNSKANS